MTVAQHVFQRHDANLAEVQRFVFRNVDWPFYEVVGQQLAERRVFGTYYKGTLEVATVSFVHARIREVLSHLIWILAEETDTPIISAGMTTLKRPDLDEGIEPDLSDYTAHHAQIGGKQEIDLALDPPPDLAVEVEITNRLAERRNIYREIGVPEIWLYGQAGLKVLCRGESDYELVERSPTFPQISLRELTEFILAGLGEDETAWSKAFRARVREVIAAAPPKS
jgi:Uma2 family endonuclease